MTVAQLEFITLMEICEPRRRSAPSADWMRNAMKVIHLVPVKMTSAEAAAAFVRWLYEEPPHEGDGAMREILAARIDEPMARTE